MRKVMIFAALGCVLGACSAPKSVGFTGIGSEPGSVARAQNSSVFSGGAGYSATNSAAYAASTGNFADGLPLRRTGTGNNRKSSMAEAAVRTASNAPNTSVPISIVGAPLALSLVEVNDTLFAVAKEPIGSFRQVFKADQMGQQFLARVPSLTGCQPTGKGYSFATTRPATSGAAVPIDC